jgi:hypothetical protein
MPGMRSCAAWILNCFATGRSVGCRPESRQLDRCARGLRVRYSIGLFLLNWCQEMPRPTGTCHSVRPRESAAGCGYRVLPGVPGHPSEHGANIDTGRSRPLWPGRLDHGGYRGGKV